MSPDFLWEIPLIDLAVSGKWNTIIHWSSYRYRRQSENDFLSLSLSLSLSSQFFKSKFAIKFTLWIIQLQIWCWRVFLTFFDRDFLKYYSNLFPLRSSTALFYYSIISTFSVVRFIFILLLISFICPLKICSHFDWDQLLSGISFHRRKIFLLHSCIACKEIYVVSNFKIVDKWIPVQFMVDDLNTISIMIR